MLTFILFGVVPILGWIFMLCFNSGRNNFKIIGGGGLIICVSLLIKTYDFWAGLFLILAFIWNMFALIVGKNKKIKPKEAIKEFWTYLKFDKSSKV
ncbi:hypothetical protein EGK75_00265 [Neisseria weixii]|uniref:hypothetical protein n=1 Tax=Neisseria weixii TaxID=1853276 RepID=UPI000F50C7F6|nr:hypothetical protein [Neisseria weixii]RPD91018.1 hypothetical protein EGK75_00265 [Neisseria weixii]